MHDLGQRRFSKKRLWPQVTFETLDRHFIEALPVYIAIIALRLRLAVERSRVRSHWMGVVNFVDVIG